MLKLKKYNDVKEFYEINREYYGGHAIFNSMVRAKKKATLEKDINKSTKRK